VPQALHRTCAGTVSHCREASGQGGILLQDVEGEKEGVGHDLAQLTDAKMYLINLPASIRLNNLMGGTHDGVGY
jgi:hypothetical protein